MAMEGEKTSVSLSVRKIENGVIVTRTVSGPKTYTSTERFMPKAPAEMARMMGTAAKPAAKPAAKRAPAKPAAK